jgi:predicted transcriptional regulator
VADDRAARTWTFLSNHGHVLVHVSRHPQARLRDVAAGVGITERAAQSILAELEQAGYVSKTRVGRRNHYRVHDEAPFRHPAESTHAVGELLRIFSDTVSPAR